VTIKGFLLQKRQKSQPFAQGISELAILT